MVLFRATGWLEFKLSVKVMNGDNLSQSLNSIRVGGRALVVVEKLGFHSMQLKSWSAEKFTCSSDFCCNWLDPVVCCRTSTVGQPEWVVAWPTLLTGIVGRGKRRELVYFN